MCIRDRVVCASPLYWKKHGTPAHPSDLAGHDALTHSRLGTHPQWRFEVEGKPLDAATIEKAAAIARDEVHPIDDVRASAWYRKEMIHNITKRILSHVAQA